MDFKYKKGGLFINGKEVETINYKDGTTEQFPHNTIDRLKNTFNIKSGDNIVVENVSNSKIDIR